MNWAVCAALIFAGVCTAIVLRPRKHNKRTGLPAPKPDDRDSIANFRRMHRS